MIHKRIIYTCLWIAQNQTVEVLRKASSFSRLRFPNYCAEHRPALVCVCSKNTARGPSTPTPSLARPLPRNPRLQLSRVIPALRVDGTHRGYRCEPPSHRKAACATSPAASSAHGCPAASPAGRDTSRLDPIVGHWGVPPMRWKVASPVDDVVALGHSLA